jgi:phosphoribosylaminoimidazole (AIR) synthetase
MGCGFCVVVPADDKEAALALLRAHYPTAQRIGRVAEGSRQIVGP